MRIEELRERLAPVLDVAAEHAQDVDRRARFPRESIDALGRQGLLGLTVPTTLGGVGAGPLETYEVVSSLARCCASSGMVATMHYSAVAVLVEEGGEPFAPVLREVAAGEHLSTLALSERATRSNFWISMGAAELREDGGATLQVDKSFVTSAGPASSYVVSTRAPGVAEPGASQLWLVRAEQPGVEVLDWWQGSGLRGNSSAPMRFSCELGADAAIGASGEGARMILETILPWFQLGSAATSVGLARAAADFAVGHVTGTVLEHLGQRLVDQPVVRHTLGRLVARADLIDGFARSVAAAIAGGAVRPEQVLELKALANDTALEVTDLAMRLGGGAAYSGGSSMDRLFRDARAGVVMAPTADMLYEMIGRVAAGEPPLDPPSAVPPQS